MKNKRNLHQALAHGQSKPYLSVIIPTLNEIAYLPQLLDALAIQTRLPDEIIVADAGSEDGTAEFAQSRDIGVVCGGIPAVGRNAGARAAKGDLLFFLDADVLPPTDFIGRVLEEFEQKKQDVATCFIAPLNGNPLDVMICVGTNLYFQIIQPVSPHAPGFCIISKRTAHEKMGGFDESLTLSEDIDYARRAKRIGKFGFLSSTRIPVSMRRVVKEGLVGLGLKYAWCEVYALMGKPVRKAPFRYEFGTFNPSRESISRALINKDFLYRQWEKLGYALERFRRNNHEQFDR